MHIVVTQNNRPPALHKVRVYHSLESAVRDAWEAHKDRSTTLKQLCIDHPYCDSLTFDEALGKELSPTSDKESE